MHLAVLRLALTPLALAFTVAQTVAAMVAMSSNFFLNNFFTYRDRRLMGWRLVRGLVSFYLICGLGWSPMSALLHMLSRSTRPGGSRASRASWWGRSGITLFPRSSLGDVTEKARHCRSVVGSARAIASRELWRLQLKGGKRACDQGKVPMSKLVRRAALLFAALLGAAPELRMARSTRRTCRFCDRKRQGAHRPESWFPSPKRHKSR